MPAKELLETDCNPDRKKPSAKQVGTRLPPQELRITEIVAGIQKLLKS